MRISESIRKNIFEVSAGRVLNRIKIKRRRNTLFFEEIGAEYIRRCEEEGYGKEMMDVGKEWMLMFSDRMIPGSLKKIPPFILLNTIMRKLWVTGGLMSDFHASRKGETITIETRNEGLTRIIGKNHLVTGFYNGLLNTVFRCELEPVSFTQTREQCKYRFKIRSKSFNPIRSKEKSYYDKLNYLETVRGFTLKDLLEKKVFQLKEDNRIYFRNRSISPMENTIFHLIGNKGILLDDIPEISYDYFKGIVKDTDDTNKLALIKTLLQAMGWGVVNIIIKGKNITFHLNHPPYGLQAEKDNWEFVARVILGYLWLLDREFNIKQLREDYKKLRIEYSA